jgi:hypothetical protein
MWKDTPGAIRALPGKIGSTNALHGAINGAFVLSSGISMVQDGRSAASRNRMVGEMKADMEAISKGTGNSAASSARVSLVKEYALKGVADVANIAINFKQMVSHRFGMKGALIGMGIAFAAERLAEGLFADHKAEAYVSFKQLQLAAKAQGAELTAEHYAQFLAQASDDLAKRGGASSRFTQEVAAQYAAEGATAAQIMVEVQNGALMARVHNAIKANEQAKLAEPKPVAHAAQVRGQAMDRSHRKILGEQTQRVVSQDQAMTPGMGKA